MKKTKKITAGCLAAFSIASLLCIDACADDSKPTFHDWRALDRYVSGAPSNVNSEPDIFAIWHGEYGAIATMKGITHTTPGASSKTTIYCTTYKMDYVQITNYSTTPRKLEPDVGSPYGDVEVHYKVSVSTNTMGDTVVSTGRIEKIG